MQEFLVVIPATNKSSFLAAQKKIKKQKTAAVVAKDSEIVG